MKSIEIQPLQKPITASVAMPGSKSYTNRALLLAALTKENVTIKNPLFSDDTQAMIECLQTLGIKITISENQIEVIGSITDVQNKDYELNADLSGITIRFILALATIIPGTKTILGKEGLNKRPIKDLVDALRQLGAEIEYLEKDGFPPLKVTSSKLKPGTISLNGSLSSQYLSALLMIAPIIGNVTIKRDGELISKPYIDMTIAAMKAFDVDVRSHEKEFVVHYRQTYHANEYVVEGDFSSAGYFFAIAALTKSTITITNLNPESKQADKKILSVLEKMGSKVTYRKNEITIVGNGVQPMEIDVTDFPDQAQTLAVLAAFADGETKLLGVKSLRIKETERVVAVQNELKKMGIKTSATENVLIIHGGDPQPAAIDTYGDHRMAMSFAVAGTKLARMRINDPEVVSKTFPDFWKKLEGLKVEKKTNIVLIGMRGSGKSTIGKLLAKKLHKDFIDLDKLLEQKLEMPVAKIVAEDGWDYFREYEAKIAHAVANVTDTVIATGGGFVLQKNNIDALKTNGAFIYLEASVETLLERIGEDANRAPLTDKKTKKEEIKEVMKQRKSLYEQAADIMINTKGINQEQTVAKIVSSRLEDFGLDDLMTKNMNITTNTTICMVIGDPVEHSLSPQIHNAAYEALNLDFNFVAKQVKASELSDFIKEVKTKNIRGVSVTLPHKITIMQYLDKIDEVAQRIGAVNTVVNDERKLTGYNTDIIGILEPLEKITSLLGKTVALLGAGGAARAAAYCVTSRGAKLSIYNRTIEKAEELTKEFGGEAFSRDSLEKIKDADIIINTTSLGLHPDDETPLPKQFISEKHLVFDLVYTKNGMTKLLMEAKEQGAQTISGIEMLLHQGFEQFKLFTKHDAPKDAMRKTII